MPVIALFRKVFHLVEHRSHINSGRMELRKRLRDARKDAKLNVQDVADALGVGRAQVWRMESKNADFISVGRLRVLANLYGRPVTYFFDDDLEIGDQLVAYQLIGMAISVTQTVANRMSKRPSPALIESATLAVIRAQQDRWADDPKSMFNPDEFVMLIEQHFKRGRIK
ncbi:MAG: helix-turn-helix domain-containing protein [Sulfitobacter sp.]